MSRRARFQKKPNTTFSLNINSMTDMFTIMLVFLLQTYSTNAFEIKPQKGVRMPTSVSEQAPADAPIVSLSQENLFLNDKSLLDVDNYQIPAPSLDQGQIILPLLGELKSLKTLKPQLEEIILQIDKDCPYPQVQQILSTATMAGFLKVRLATISGS